MELNAKLYVFKSYLHYNSRVVKFTENSANYGGAVYVDDGTYFATCYRQDIECFVQIITIPTADGYIPPKNYDQPTIIFEYNSAESWTHGPNLFGGLLHRCTVSPYEDITLLPNFHNDVDNNGINYFKNITHLSLNQTFITSCLHLSML